MKRLSALLLVAVCVFLAGCIDDSDKDVDIDFTTLNTTMLYAQAEKAINEANKYVGQTFKISGNYTPYHDIASGRYYHYLVVVDDESCCTYPFEFVLSGNPVYPDDFPEENAEFQIIGVYKSYRENGKTWYYIATDEIVIL